MKPIVYDLFCGLGGWTEGFLAEGWRCIGFDIERHEYGDQKYPGELRLRDVLTLHGSELADAACIVASPPCQEYSYMAMPWKRGKQIALALRTDGYEGQFPKEYTGSQTIAELTALFDACFRIQREAIEATRHMCPACLDLRSLYYPNCKRCHNVGSVTRYIPMVVENVKGAQPWVGQAKANFGSFYFWGDIETVNGNIVCGRGFDAEILRPPSRSGGKFNPDGTEHPQGSWFAIADSKNRGVKRPGMDWSGSDLPGYKAEAFTGNGCKVPGRSFQSAAVSKQPVWFNDDKMKATKCGGDWFGSGDDCSLMRNMGSASPARKAASALIAKIPYDVSSYVARAYHPSRCH